MNLFLIILIVLIFLFPLWALLGGGEKEKANGKNEVDLLSGRRASDATDSPEVKPEKKQRRARDSKSPDEDGYEKQVEVGTDFSLPFQPPEIIPTGSPFGVYSKTLANAEAYIKKGDFGTAQSLYEGIHDRVSDAEIRRKIEENIDYINNYHQLAAQRLEVKKKKERDGKEIRFTLEGSEALADRVQISIAPEKPLVDMDQIVKRITDRITGTSPSPSMTAEEAKSFEKYKDEISKIRNDLQDVTKLKDEVRKLSENRLQKDLDEVTELKNELKSLREEPSSVQDKLKHLLSPAQDDLAVQKERNILDKIRQREDENKVLRERLDLLQNELSFLREENKKTSDLEDILSSKIEDMKKSESAGTSPRKSAALENNEAVTVLRDEIDQLKDTIQELSSHAKTESSMSDLAGTMKDSMNTLNDALKSSVSGGPSDNRKPEENKKDEFQLMDELINGPKFEEPTEEEVLGKILNDAMKEHSRKNEPKKSLDERIEEEKKKNAEKKKDELKNDFELVSDYLKNDDADGPTDEQVMEKILKDAMKNKDFRQSAGFEGPQYASDQSKPTPGKKRKELPILRVSYNFSRLPDEFTLSLDKNHLEYSFYKFKPLLEKASDLVKRRKVKDAINYFRVVMDQDIPKEFKDMLGQNISDLTEYLTKYYTS
jgi:hypothetical protein